MGNTTGNNMETIRASSQVCVRTGADGKNAKNAITVICGRDIFINRVYHLDS